MTDTAVRVRRPMSVLEQNLRMDLADAQAELRDVAAANTSAKALYRYVTLVADSTEAEQHAARIYFLTDRARRRHG